MSKEQASQTLPFVSVVMAVRNEAASISNTIQGILKQDYPPVYFEVIIADGCSSDKTKDIIAEIQKKHSNVKILDNPGKIVSTGLNAAIRAAKGEIIVRVDGHTELARDYIRQCVFELMRTDADNVGGRMTAVGETLMGETVAEATSHPFGIGNSTFHYAEDYSWADTVYLGAWRRKTFDENGLFDENFVRNQDDEWNYRLRKRGGKILISPLIHSRYFCRNDLKSLAKQYFQYGYWKVKVMEKHQRQMRMRHFIPGCFILSLILSGTAAFLRISNTLFFAVLAIYLICSFSASAIIAFKKRKKLLFLLPLVFFVLHSSYGTGFCCGLAASFFKKHSK